MKRLSALLLIPLALVTACEVDNSRPDTDFDNDSEGDDQPTVYRYLLGSDGETRMHGGAHWVKLPEDIRGIREAIDDANRGDRLHPELSQAEYMRYDASITEGETDWDVFASQWWPQSKNGTAWRWQPGANQDYNDLSDRDRLSPIEKYDLAFNGGNTSKVSAQSG